MSKLPCPKRAATRITIGTEDIAFIRSKHPRTSTNKPQILLDLNSLLSFGGSMGSIVIYALSEQPSVLSNAPPKQVPVTFQGLRTTTEAKYAYADLRDEIRAIVENGVHNEWEHNVPNGVKRVLEAGFRLAMLLSTQKEPEDYRVKIKLPKQMGGRTVVASGLSEETFVETVLAGAYWKEKGPQALEAMDLR